MFLLFLRLGTKTQESHLSIMFNAILPGFLCDNLINCLCVKVIIPEFASEIKAEYVMSFKEKQSSENVSMSSHKSHLDYTGITQGITALVAWPQTVVLKDLKK